jgi:hypothetical protein
MTQQQDNYVKILFQFYNDVLEQHTTETMWATIVDADKGLFKLDSIPFYAPLVASNDIVFAEYDETEKMLTYRKTVEYSGNSTVQVVLMDKTQDIKSIRKTFQDLGCVSEKVNDGYFSMEIPADQDYETIKQRLTELEDEGILGYAEPCLSERHQY